MMTMMMIKMLNADTYDDLNECDYNASAKQIKQTNKQRQKNKQKKSKTNLPFQGVVGFSDGFSPAAPSEKQLMSAPSGKQLIDVW